LAGLTVDRPDVDDAAPAAFDHAAERRLGHVEASAKVDAHHIMPVVIAHARERSVARDSGVVNDDVDRPDLGGDLCAAIEARLMIADIPFIGPDARPLAEFAGPFVIAGIVGDNGRPCVFQREADCLPDAAAATRDDCDTCHVADLPKRRS
jgi:hypothetical protein